MKIKKSDIGRVAMVQFDDVGKIEGILVSIHEYSVPTSHKEASVFFLYDKSVEKVEMSQIVGLGKRITMPE